MYALDPEWEQLKNDYPAWRFTTSGEVSVSGPGGPFRRVARCGRVTLVSESIKGLRLQLENTEYKRRRE
jgi:hypothetical protein